MGHSTTKSRSTGSGAASPIDAKVVRELAKILNETGLTEIEVERGDLRVRVAKEAAREIVHAAAPGLAMTAPPVASHASPPETPGPRNDADAASHPGAVASPMVGTAYMSPEPDKPPFVTVGQQVTQGDTLLLIEAMKTFNPIPATKSGKVLEILVSDSQPVEFGETLVIVG